MCSHLLQRYTVHHLSMATKLLNPGVCFWNRTLLNYVLWYSQCNSKCQLFTSKCCKIVISMYLLVSLKVMVRIFSDINRIHWKYFVNNSSSVFLRAQVAGGYLLVNTIHSYLHTRFNILASNLDTMALWMVFLCPYCRSYKSC